MRSVSSLLRLLLLAAWLCTPCWAQRGRAPATPSPRNFPTAPQPQQPVGAVHHNEPTFKTRSELVLVPVVVTDGSGAHVTGLQKDEFVVKENGKAQPVTVFEEVKTTQATRVKKDILPPGTYSNFMQEQTPKRLVIIALDMINTPAMDQVYAREQLVKYLSDNVDPGALISLVAIGRGRLRVIHDFTSDPALLVAALKKARGETPAIDAEQQVADAAALQAETDVMQDFLTMTPGQFMAQAGVRAAIGEQRIAVLDTLFAIQQLAQAYAGVPGRKALVWATAGFPFSLGSAGLESARGIGADGLSDVIMDYEKTWDVLNDANVALYPVDVRGLVNTAWIPASVGSASLGRGADAGRRYVQAQQARFRDTIATMQTFAEATGGEAFYNTNDLSRSFRRASDDAATYYLLGYYLEKDAKPGWHKLHVQVHHSGAHVRARDGFFVTAATQDPRLTQKSDIALAMASPLEFTGLPFTVKWGAATPIPDSPKRRVSFNIILPVGTVTVDDADSNHVQMEFVGVARTHIGGQAGDFVQSVEGHLKAESVEQIKTHGMVYDNTLDLPRGDYGVRIVVRDGVSGRIGSVTAPLTVQ